MGKVQFEVICQGVMYFRNRFFLKNTPRSEVQCTLWSFITYLLNRISPLFSSTTVTKLSYHLTGSQPLLQKLDLNIISVNTIDGTFWLNFTLKLNVLHMHSELRWEKDCVWQRTFSALGHCFMLDS